MHARCRSTCSAERRGAGTASKARSSRRASSNSFSSSSLRSCNARWRRKETSGPSCTSPTPRCTRGLGSGATCERRGKVLGRSWPCGSGSDRRPGRPPVLMAVVLPLPFAVSTLLNVYRKCSGVLQKSRAKRQDFYLGHDGGYMIPIHSKFGQGMRNSF